MGIIDPAQLPGQRRQGTVRDSLPRRSIRVSSASAAQAYIRSGFYPAIHYILGSWYTPREIGKRAMIYWLAGTIGKSASMILADVKDKCSRVSYKPLLTKTSMVYTVSRDGGRSCPGDVD